MYVGGKLLEEGLRAKLISESRPGRALRCQATAGAFLSSSSSLDKLPW